METELVSGKTIPKSDHVLSLLLGLPDAASLTDKSILRFGIENIDGDIYRIVGLRDPFAFADLLDLLPQFRYDVELVETAMHNGLRARIRKQG
jgi:hypothetical protein